MSYANILPNDVNAKPLMGKLNRLWKSVDIDTNVDWWLPTGKASFAEGRKLSIITQHHDEEQHLPAHDPHTGPTQ